MNWLEVKAWFEQLPKLKQYLFEDRVLQLILSHYKHYDDCIYFRLAGGIKSIRIMPIDAALLSLTKSDLDRDNWMIDAFCPTYKPPHNLLLKDYIRADQDRIVDALKRIKNWEKIEFLLMYWLSVQKKSQRGLAAKFIIFKLPKGQTLKKIVHLTKNIPPSQEQIKEIFAESPSPPFQLPTTRGETIDFDQAVEEYPELDQIMASQINFFQRPSGIKKAKLLTKDGQLTSQAKKMAKQAITKIVRRPIGPKFLLSTPRQLAAQNCELWVVPAEKKLPQQGPSREKSIPSDQPYLANLRDWMFDDFISLQANIIFSNNQYLVLWKWKAPSQWSIDQPVSMEILTYPPRKRIVDLTIAAEKLGYQLIQDRIKSLCDF
jgi:hypothetical protein